jgi:hypothetical protein
MGFLTSSLGATLPAVAGAAIGFVLIAAGAWTGCGLEAGLDMLDTVVFFAGTTGFFAAAVAAGATFFATGLAVLLAAGAFLAALPATDEWAGLAAAFLAGAIFLTLGVDFLAGLAAFFLVAIQLGFF